MRTAPKSVIRTAVFPVAGRGTRFLPATKASPKEMLPVVDKPLIQYAVEEALAAGATRLVFITGAAKRAISRSATTMRHGRTRRWCAGPRRSSSATPRTPPRRREEEQRIFS